MYFNRFSMGNGTLADTDTQHLLPSTLLYISAKFSDYIVCDVGFASLLSYQNIMSTGSWSPPRGQWSLVAALVVVLSS